jgi:ADP-ribosylation factor-binding protein GGA
VLACTNNYQGLSLNLQAQSGRSLQAQQKDGITQIIRVNGVERGKGNTVKMRWKASYKLGTEMRQEQGQVENLGVA